MQESPILLVPVPIEEFSKIREQLQEIQNLITQRPREDTLLLPGEAMKLLRIKDYSTLWRWEKNGIIKRVETEGRPRFRKSDVMALIEKGNEAIV